MLNVLSLLSAGIVPLRSSGSVFIIIQKRENLLSAENRLCSSWWSYCLAQRHTAVHKILSTSEASHSSLNPALPNQEIAQRMLAHFMHFIVFPIRWFGPPSTTKPVHSKLASLKRNRWLTVTLNSSIRHIKLIQGLTLLTPPWCLAYIFKGAPLFSLFTICLAWLWMVINKSLRFITKIHWSRDTIVVPQYCGLPTYQ